jgi:hypothetical protein
LTDTRGPLAAYTLKGGGGGRKKKHVQLSKILQRERVYKKLAQLPELN